MDDAIDSKYSFGYTVCLSSKSEASPRVTYQDTSPHSKNNGCPPPFLEKVSTMLPAVCGAR